MSKSVQTNWWVLQWSNGTLDIDADGGLHLHKTQQKAEDAAHDYLMPRPRAVRLKLVVGRKPTKELRDRRVTQNAMVAHKALNEARKAVTALSRLI